MRKGGGGGGYASPRTPKKAEHKGRDKGEETKHIVFLHTGVARDRNAGNKSHRP